MKHYGFVPPIRIEKEEYILGASPMPFIKYKPDGVWSSPEKEMQQKNGVETYNCTAFNLCAQAEVFMKEVYGLNVNYSDRFLAVVAGTKAPGNDPQTVYEAARKYGFIPDYMMPFAYDILTTEQYLSWKGVDQEACIAEGKKWLEKWDFFHEWVTTEGLTEDENIHNQKVALTSSPLCRDVYAWYADERNVYVKLSDANHWTCEKAYEDYAKISDSYEPTEKDVEQHAEFCKRIYIAKKEIVPIKVSFWQQVLEWFRSQRLLLNYFNAGTN